MKAYVLITDDRRQAMIDIDDAVKLPMILRHLQAMGRRCEAVEPRTARKWIRKHGWERMIGEDEDETMTRTRYDHFLARKSQLECMGGFEPVFTPSLMFDFQRALAQWAIRKGRAALFADCGLGKTLIELVYAENVVRHTNGRVLIMTPLAVSHQTVREAEKFGIECTLAQDGGAKGKILVTNYERLHHLDPSDFVGAVCDESQILKNFDGKRRGQITEFLKKLKYRLLCTATAAPNDYTELGTSSEALGELGHIDMLQRFFKNDQNSIKPTWVRRFEDPKDMFGDGGKWRFKGHAELPFWRWVCSWARAIRKPSDIGYSDDRYDVPPLLEREHIVEAEQIPDGMLFALPAVGLREQRDERRRSVTERCERVAELVRDHPASVVWCQLNDEGDLLESIIPDAVQVSGSDPDEAKEEKLLAFAAGEIRRIVTKQKICGLGLNWQHCAHIVTFPSHSYEQYYQGIRRCWRFGQDQPVQVDIVASAGERDVLSSLRRKSAAAERMFENLIREMNRAERIERPRDRTVKEVLPAWL